MRYRFIYLLVPLIALAAGAQIARAQSSADQNRGRNRPVVDGGVESVEGRLQVSLYNTDDIREFRGVARISLGASNQQSERVEFRLAPQELRFFPLGSRGAPGDNYTLEVFEQGGALIFIKNAPVKRGTVMAPIVTAPAPTNPTSAPAARAATTVAKELTVKALLIAARPGQSQGDGARSRAVQQPNPPQIVETPTQEQPGEPQVAIVKKPSARRARRGQSAEVKMPAVEHQIRMESIKEPEIVEAPVSDEPGPLALRFEISSPSPIIKASLSVSANEFKQRQSVTVKGSANVEFKLPEDFEEPIINYALTDASGRALAQGQLVFEDLMAEDSVTVSDVKLDKETYDPGESAHFVVTLEGRSPNGYRLEVIAKGANAETLLNDNRKGVYSKGKAIQEFRVEIPAEARGIISVEFKAFGNLTGKLFGYVVREITINDTQNYEIEDRRSRIEDRGSSIEDRGSSIEYRRLSTKYRRVSLIAILDPRSSILDPRSSIFDPRSSILYPLSSILDPRSSILDPRCFYHG